MKALLAVVLSGVATLAMAGDKGVLGDVDPRMDKRNATRLYGAAFVRTSTAPTFVTVHDLAKSYCQAAWDGKLGIVDESLIIACIREFPEIANGPRTIIDNPDPVEERIWQTPIACRVNSVLEEPPAWCVHFGPEWCLEVLGLTLGGTSIDSDAVQACYGAVYLEIRASREREKRARERGLAFYSLEICNMPTVAECTAEVIEGCQDMGSTMEHSMLDVARGACSGSCTNGWTVSVFCPPQSPPTPTPPAPCPNPDDYAPGC